VVLLMMITVVTTGMEMMIIMITIHAGRIAGSGCAGSWGRGVEQAAQTLTVE
jgi:hypothetical protein